MRVLESEGFKVTYLPVQKNGLIDLKVREREETNVAARLRLFQGIGFGFDTTDESLFGNDGQQRDRRSTADRRNRCVSTKCFSSLGRTSSLRLGKLCRAKKVFFHTDAAQAVGKVPVDVNAMNIDLMSISGHKIYGPKGVGALYVRRRPRVRLDPIQTGGGQERNVRSGTVPTPLVVGLGAACQIAQEELPVRYLRILFASIPFFSFSVRRKTNRRVVKTIDRRSEQTLHTRDSQR